MVYVILFQPFKTGSRSISIKNEQVPSQMVADKKYCQTIKINLPMIAPYANSLKAKIVAFK